MLDERVAKLFAESSAEDQLDLFRSPSHTCFFVKSPHAIQKFGYRLDGALSEVADVGESSVGDCLAWFESGDEVVLHACPCSVGVNHCLDFVVLVGRNEVHQGQCCVIVVGVGVAAENEELECTQPLSGVIIRALELRDVG